jgi:inosine-uridine nucleoside N-ribohydrolase
MKFNSESMISKIARLTVVLTAWILVTFYPCSGQLPSDKINIILDTDMGPDYDDVGALAVLHAMADSGKIQILGTFSCNRDSLAVPAIEVLNTYFGRPGIPNGAPKKNGVTMSASQHWTDSIVSRFPHKVPSTRMAPDAVAGYRKILASQPDNSVTIVTIGFLTNLSNLLQSLPDRSSRLNGKELVAKKVKVLVSMAGGFPKGKEFNVYMDSCASKYCFENWPTEILFSGFEIGEKVKTGLKLISMPGSDNPVKEAFRIAMSVAKEDRLGRMSWDQTAVILAIYGHEPFFSTVKGSIRINSDGSNGWDEQPDGKHLFIRFDTDPEIVGKYIEDRMMHNPVKK